MDQRVCFIAVGTDGHRLAACKTDLEITETACLPADVLSDVCETLVNTGSTAYITFGDGEVAFENDVIYAVIRTLEGQFPPWRSVIPKSVETTVRLSKKTMEMYWIVQVCLRRPMTMLCV